MEFDPVEVRRIRARIAYYNKLKMVGQLKTPQQEQKFVECRQQYDEIMKLKPVKSDEEKAAHTIEMIERNKQHARENYAKNKDNPEYKARRREQAKRSYQKLKSVKIE